MKRKITLIIEALVIVFFVVLSQIKAGEALKATARAEKLAHETVKLQEAAQREVELAERMAAEAIKAQTALIDCMAGK